MVKLGFVISIAFTLIVMNNAFEVKPRIVRGYSAESGQFPFFAFLEGHTENPGERSACGGSLISDEWVLTAAHCLRGAQTIVVHLGKTVLNRPERTHVRVPVDKSKFFIFPRYQADKILHDIGLYF